MNSLRYPPNVQWEVTSECNHNCIHCYNYWRKDHQKIAGMCKFHTEEEYLILASKIIEQKPVSVVITGGEPLLVFDKIKSSIELLLKHGIYVSINTNAALLTEEIVDFLVEHKMGIFVSFPCSDEKICDFITGKKGSVQSIVEKLDLAYSKKLPFTTNIVVSTANILHVQDTAAFLKERYDLPNVYITRVGKPINSDETFNQYMLDFKQLARLQDICVYISKNMGMKVETSCPYTACSLTSKEAFELFAYTKACTAGRTSYAVDTGGNVKACPRDSTLYGNILTEDFGAIWARTEDWRNGSYIPEECKTCASLSMCMGGCRVDSLPFTGKLNKLDTISNTANLPIKYTKTSSSMPVDFCDTDSFNVPQSIKFIEEAEGFYRVSVNRRYMFITPALFLFLSTHNTFKLSELASSFDVSTEIANNVVKSLVSNNIVFTKTKGE